MHCKYTHTHARTHTHSCFNSDPVKVGSLWATVSGDLGVSALLFLKPYWYLGSLCNTHTPHTNTHTNMLPAEELWAHSSKTSLTRLASPFSLSLYRRLCRHVCAAALPSPPPHSSFLPLSVSLHIILHCSGQSLLSVHLSPSSVFPNHRTKWKFPNLAITWHRKQCGRCFPFFVPSEHTDKCACALRRVA